MGTRLGAAVLAACAAAGLLAPPAVAEESSTERLAGLEAALADQAAQLEALRAGTRAVPAPAPSDDPRLARAPSAAWPSPAGRGLRVGGYLQAIYLGRTDENSHFDLHRFVLSLDGDITDCIDVAAEIEFEHGGIGDRGTGEVKIEHATVTWHLNDHLELRLGAPLIPFGRYNRFHEDPHNDLTQRPWVARYFVPTGFGQPGIGLGGSCPIGCGALTWDTLISTGFDDDFTNDKGVREARPFWEEDNNEAKQLWGRAAWTQTRGPLDFLEVGASLTWARYDDAGRDEFWGFGVDLLLRKGPFELQGEYVRFDIERDGLDPATATRGMEGLWLQIAYHFMPCALRRCNSCVVRDTSHFTLAVRYQAMDLDDRRTGASFNDDLEGWTIGLNYRLTEDTVLRVDHQWLDAAREPDQREWTVSFSTTF